MPWIITDASSSILSMHCFCHSTSSIPNASSSSKWDKSGAFSDQISVHLAPLRQMHWNLIWKKPDLSHFGPIWPTLEPNLPSLISTLWNRAKMYCQPILRNPRFISVVAKLVDCRPNMTLQLPTCNSVKWHHGPSNLFKTTRFNVLPEIPQTSH